MARVTSFQASTQEKQGKNTISLKANTHLSLLSLGGYPNVSLFSQQVLVGMVSKSVSKLARGTTYIHDEEVVVVEINYKT